VQLRRRTLTQCQVRGIIARCSDLHRQIHSIVRSLQHGSRDMSQVRDGSVRAAPWNQVAGRTRPCTTGGMRALPYLVAIGITATASVATGGQQADSRPADQKQTLPVNWLYGAYVPKDAPLESLSSQERWQLWARQTALTPGIYFKTGLFALGDQIADAPAEWHGGVAGFGQRFASRYGQFAIQTSLAAAGDWALGYEPRYERCRCSGVWPRARHALVRNFVTYNATERTRRPQIAMYAGAWGAGLVASTWKPAKDDLWKEGYSSLITQAAFGSLANLVGEFAEEIKTAVLHRHGAHSSRRRNDDIRDR